MQNNKETLRAPSSAPNAANAGAGTISYLGPGLRIQGDISGNEDLKLDSTVDGQISIGGFRLTVGPGAHLNGDIVAREAVISGEVTGDIRACDRIEIMKNASIAGDLSTGKIVIEEGAYLKGTLEVASGSPQIGADLDALLSSSKKKHETQTGGN